MAGILNVDEIADSTGTRHVNFPNGISIDNNRISDIPGYNYIINGNFDVWQRGTSQTVSGYGSSDRWMQTNVGATKVSSRQAFAIGQEEVPNNPQYYIRTVVTSVTGAGNLCALEQRIEGVRTLAGKKATLSFFAKADAPKNIAISLHQSFGTGGSPSEIIVGIEAQKVAITASWVKYTIVLDIPSITGKVLGTNGDDALGLTIWFDAGSNWNSRTDSLGHQSGTFDIACVSLVEGDVDVKPIPRSYGEELALCQRYYSQNRYTNGGYSTYAGGVAVSRSCFNPQLRAIPILTLNIIEVAGVATSIQFVDTSSASTGINALCSSSGLFYVAFDIMVDAEL